ncbi:MAG: HAD family phosphatase [Alphaproteobacteria bacterium]|nr:MAG: HAD family phosphatase [Alphaproteobacteria bacterium]
MTELVIFDCDGTLVDSEIFWARHERDLIHEYGLNISLADMQRLASGKHFKDWRADTESLIGGPLPDDFGTRCIARVVQALEDGVANVPLLEGAAEMLAAIRLPRCIASNSPRDYLANILRGAGLLDIFDQKHIFSAHDVAHPKPAPDVFLHASRQMGHAPAACLVVEDSVAGVQAARAAGMQVWGVTCAYPDIRDSHAQRLRAAGAHVVLNHLSEIPGRLEPL